MIDEAGHNEDLDDLIDDERTWGDLLGDSLQPGDVLAEKYRIDELLGCGAMGFVLKAWHLQLHEPVAVKFLLPELANTHEALVRFEREARAAFKVKSEHVARVLDVGRIHSGQPFMVMEYLEGVGLGDRLYDQQMNIGELVDYMLQACDAMVEAHAVGIVHRDMKPDNLFLTQRRDGTTCVKVLDFGLSKVVARGSQAPRQKALTADAQVLGTAHYMSPEQWVASKDVGPPADIWAIGVILYEAISGESPFMRNNLAAMCNAVLREELPPLSSFRDDVPPGLDEVVRRCMAKKPEERYASVTELATALLHFATRDTRPPPRFVVEAAAESERAANVIAAARVSDAGPRFASSEPPDGLRDTMPAPRDLNRPALGLVQADGSVESWAEVLESAPVDQGSRLSVYAAVAAALALGLAYWLL